MTLFRAAVVAFAVAGAMAGASMATSAKADWDGHRHWGHGYYGPRWGWGWAPAYYYRPPVYYAPPPVYYAPPPPAYYPPGVSFGLTIR